MATDINQCILVGRLTRDPETSFTTNEKQLTKFSIACNNSYKRGEELVNNVSFFDITVWGRLAQICSEYLCKGKQVCVSGRLNQRRWETPDGAKRYKIEITGNSVQFFGGGNRPKETEKPEAVTDAEATFSGTAEETTEPLPF